MTAHFLERAKSVFRFAERDLVSGNKPVIECQTSVVIHEIFAVNHGIQLI